MPSRLRHLPLVALACANLTACASLANGSRQEIRIESVPAAPVNIDGVNVGNTPMFADLSRQRSHYVTVGGTTSATYNLTRRPSAWLLADLIFWPVLVADLLSGNGLVLEPGEINARWTATAASAAAASYIARPLEPAVPKPPPSYWGMSPGQRLRFVAPGERRVTDALLDSIADNRLYWRPIVSPGNGAARPGLSLADAREVQVLRGAKHIDGGAGMVHRSAQLTWAVPLVAFARIGSQERGFKAGAIATAIAIPLAFVAGAAEAEDRWAPLEAQRSGSPLLVNDRLQVHRLSSIESVSGRLIDMSPTHLVVSAGSDVIRVPRTDVRAVERAEGYNWLGRAMYGVAIGAMVGFMKVSACQCRPPRGDVYLVPATHALMGLLAAPALAPPRWRTVSSW